MTRANRLKSRVRGENLTHGSETAAGVARPSPTAISLRPAYLILYLTPMPDKVDNDLSFRSVIGIKHSIIADT